MSMEGEHDDKMDIDAGGAEEVISLPPAAAIRGELVKASQELSFRMLGAASQWAAELCVALPSEPADEVPLAPTDPFASIASAKKQSAVLLARTCFEMREYSRAAQALQGVKGEDLHQCPAALFLRLYALYLAGEKRREEEAVEISDPVEKCQVKNAELKVIEETLVALYKEGKLDGLNLYLYGVALRGLELKTEARKVLLESVRAFPCNWSAWLDIIAISADLNDVATAHAQLKLPDHWASWFFRASLHMELQQNEEALEIYRVLRRSFPESSHLLSQVAICYYNMRNFDASQQAFEELRRKDPHRLASLDTYSNILYVKEQAAALSHLARQAVKIDKYTPEACCIVGNYYSLKGEHEKSVTYFQRALTLNRNFTPAWILVGHEYMEMKNTPAAIDAYRTAVSINQRDYRAWYGLGQTYELLSLHFYALFYYRRAMTLRPADARMWCAMAGCYDAMDRKVEALKCYEKAHRCGDKERMALPRLARLHQDLGDRRQAAAHYGQMLQESAAGPRRPKGTGLSADEVEALRFMMVYHRDEGNLEECETCAAQLLDTAGPEKDEAKAMMRDLRSAAESATGAGGILTDAAGPPGRWLPARTPLGVSAPWSPESSTPRS